MSHTIRGTDSRCGSPALALARLQASRRVRPLPSLARKGGSRRLLSLSEREPTASLIWCPLGTKSGSFALDSTVLLQRAMSGSELSGRRAGELEL